MAEDKNYIIKIQLPTGSEYYIKDLAAWEALTNILGEPERDSEGIYHFPLIEYNSSSTKTVYEILQELVDIGITESVTDITDDGEKVTRAQDIKAYVDAQVGTIHKFDVVFADLNSAGEPDLAATEENMYKLVLTEDESAPGSYEEWILIREGQGSEATYYWEAIGTTETDLKDYLKDTATVAGVAFGDDKAITTDELKTALDLKDLSHKDTASTTYQPAGTLSTPTVTIDSPTFTAVNAVIFTPGTQASLGTPTTATYAVKVLQATPGADETLIFSYTNSTPTGASGVFDTAVKTQGTFTPNVTPTLTYTNNTITYVSTVTVSAPIFTGTTATITVS